MAQDSADWKKRAQEQLAQIKEGCQQSVEQLPERERRKQLGACMLDKVVHPATSKGELEYALHLLNEWASDSVAECNMEAQKAPNPRVKGEFLMLCYAGIPKLSQFTVSITQKPHLIPLETPNEKQYLIFWTENEESGTERGKLGKLKKEAVVVDTSLDLINGYWNNNIFKRVLLQKVREFNRSQKKIEIA